MSRALIRALEKRATAEALIAAALVHDYPKGATIVWEGNGGCRRHGCVITHDLNYPQRIKVSNARTGAQYWIAATQVRARPS